MGFRSSSVSGGGITGFFGDRAFARSLMHIALPVTLQSMLRASFSIIDQVMIGQLGSASISGIGLGGKFASIHNVVLSAVTAAGAILISQYLGQGSRKNAARSYSVNLLVSLAIAAVFTLVSTRFAEPILGLYTQDDATRALGQTYLQTYAWSFFPAALSGMGIFQPMLTALVGLVPNCAASVLLAQLYIEGAITFGSLFAGLTAGTGVGLAVLWRVNPSWKQNLFMTGLLWAVGGAAGMVLQLIL